MLPESIWSPEDLAELIGDLQRYSQWLQHYQVKQHVVPGGAAASDSPNLSATALAYLRDLQAKQQLSVERVEQLIVELQSIQTKAPRVSFTFAGPASNGLKKSFVSWCRTHIAPDVLVGFQFNATILGGMVVRYGSHIFDWSFKRQILANRAKFAEALRRV